MANEGSLLFPNLPWVECDGWQMTEFSAICAWLGRKADMAGRTDTEQAEIDRLMSVLDELRNAFFFAAYVGDERSVSRVCSKMDAKLPELEKLITRCSSLGTYLLGDRLTYADCAWFEFSETLSKYLHEMDIRHEPLSSYPHIGEWMHVMESELSTLRNSDRFLSYPYAYLHLHGLVSAFVAVRNRDLARDCDNDAAHRFLNPFAQWGGAKL